MLCKNQQDAKKSSRKRKFCFACSALASPQHRGAGCGSRCETPQARLASSPTRFFPPPCILPRRPHSLRSPGVPGNRVKTSRLYLMSQKHLVSFVASLYNQGSLTLVQAGHLLCKAFSVRRRAAIYPYAPREQMQELGMREQSRTAATPIGLRRSGALPRTHTRAHHPLQG